MKTRNHAVCAAGDSAWPRLKRLSLLTLGFSDRCVRLPNNLRQVDSNAVGEPEEDLQAGIAKPSLHETDHGFGNTGALSDSVFGEVLPFPLLLQEPDYFFANSFVMRNGGHARASQQSSVDVYCTVVQYPSQQDDVSSRCRVHTYKEFSHEK